MSAARRLGLRARLVVTFACVAALASVAVALLSYGLVRDALLRRAVDTAVREARVHLESAAATLPAGASRAQLRAFLTGLQTRGAFDVVAASGDIVETTTISLGPSAVPDHLRAAVADGRMAALRTTVAGSAVVVVGGAVQPDGPAFTFFFPLDAIQADLSLLAQVLAVTSGVLALASAGVGAAAAAGVLRPIRRARDAVREVAGGELDATLPEVGGEELAELARAFNRMTAALRRTVGELRELEAGQRRFVADVSHELRTPMTALTTAADVLDAHADGLGASGRRAAGLIVVETRRLAALVDDLMEISRMDAGAAEVRLEAVDVTAHVKAALRARRWCDRVHVDGDGGVTTLIDPRRFDAVVGNLVGNALDHGGPPVTVTVRADDATVELRVTDHGSGIDALHLPRVFDRFYKADRSRSAGGTGLGLAIARENARLHGGDITVDSRPGEGTTFTFSLPRREPVQ